MSFKRENWEPSDYQFKNLSTPNNVLPTNKNVTNAVTTDFLTYNSNNVLPCYPYQVAGVECLNKHGVTHSLMQDRPCMVS